MENDGLFNFIVNSTVLVGIFIGACVVLLMYILKLFNNDTQEVVTTKSKLISLFINIQTHTINSLTCDTQRHNAHYFNCLK